MTTTQPIIAYAFSDLHISDWAKFNKDYKRTKDALRVMKFLAQKAADDRAVLLFAGDLFHKPESMSIKLHEIWNSEIDPANFWMMCGITGNHDTPDRINYHPASSVMPQYNSWMRQLLPNNCIDFSRREFKAFDLTVWGYPYMDHNLYLNELLQTDARNFTTKRNILLLHTDFPGAKDPDGTVVGTCENLNPNLLEPFDLVLCGHIHRPQRLSKKVYMLGAPMQQRRSDRDCEFGYWVIYRDLSLEFVPLNLPKFIDVTSQDEVKDDGNFYTVISERRDTSKLEEMPVISSAQSSRKIVRAYMKSINETDKEKRRVLNNLIKEAEE